MASFTECMAKFVALRATYGVLNKENKNIDDEFISIMNNTFVNPLDELIPPDIPLPSKEYLLGITKVGNPLNILSEIFLRPFESIKSIFNTGYLSKKSKDKIANFFQQEGFALGLLDPSKLTGLIFSSAFQGVATIDHNRKIMQGLDEYIKKVCDNIKDVPTVDPIVSPFLETFDHLESAKNNYSSVRSLLATKDQINLTRYNEGSQDLQKAKDSIYDGNLSEPFAKTLVEITGTGGLLGVNEDGQIKFKNAKGISELNFLPPVGINRWMVLIRESKSQLAVYNSSLENIHNLLQYFTDNLYVIIDLGRLFSTLIQFLILQITDVEKVLQSGINNTTLGPGLIAAQTEVYGMLEVLIPIADHFENVLKIYNKNDINDIGSLKTVRKSLKKLNPENCISEYESLDSSLTKFINAYNLRVKNKIPSHTIQKMGEKTRKIIKLQQDYLNCFEDVLNELPLNNIPPWILGGMKWVGSIMAFLQNLDIKLPNFDFPGFSFDPTAKIVAEMKEALHCMKGGCDQPAVNELVDKLIVEFDKQDMKFRIGSNLNTEFAKQARFKMDLKRGDFSKLIQQFIDTVASISC